MPVRALPVLCVVLALAGCSGGEPTATPTPSATASPKPSPSSTAAPSPAPSARPTVDAVVPPEQPPTATPSGTTTTAPPAPPVTRPPVETAPPPGQPLCRASDLTLDDADAVITSAAVQELFVVRTSGPDCQLQGYPDVVLRGEGGAALSVDYTRGGGGLDPAEPEVVTLSRSTSLSFRVATPRTGSCSPAATISARLPGTDGDLTATTGLSVCQSQAGISPVGRLRAES